MISFTLVKGPFRAGLERANEAEIKLRQILPYLVEDNQIEILIPKLLNQMGHLFEQIDLICLTRNGSG